jgi:hypothetical protein
MDMTKSRFAGICLAVIMAAILAPAGARADTLVLTGAGGPGGSNIANGVYLLPYYGSINGGSSVQIVCDDYAHEVTIGESWSFGKSTIADLSNTRWGTADLVQYEKTFWLISQVPSHSNLNDITGIQFAIWDLFYPSTPSVPGESDWLTAANTAAASNFGGMNFSNYVILTPLNPTTGRVDQSAGSAQEYILVTPEPSALFMFGTGILGVLGIARRKLSI